MSKIPVGQTIASSYRFVFRKYFSLLGIAWLPLAIMSVASYFYVRMTLAPAAAIEAGPYNFALLIPFYLVILGLLVVTAMGIIKEALGIRHGSPFAYFHFGADELRAAGAILLLAVIVYVAIAVVAIIGGIIGAIAIGVHAANGETPLEAEPMRAALQVIGIIMGMLFLLGIVGFYFAVRLGYLLLPAAAAEHKFGIGRSWVLTRGNFWRATAVTFVTTLPVVTINLIIAWVTLGPVYAGILNHLGDADALAAQAGQMQQLLRAQLQYLPYLSALGLIVSPVTYGLLFVPAALSYRALAPGEPVAATFD